MSEQRAAAAAPSEGGRLPLPVVAGGALALCLVRVVPYLVGGPGFFLDDWRNLARIETVGWLRSAEASRFASRPGAWAVETVLYPTLRDHPVAWVMVLAVLGAAVATVGYVLLCRFAPPTTALAVVALWVVLPNHTSLRTFANTAPMTVGLLLLLVGVLLMDDGRPLAGALVAAAGGLCYEVMLIPALAALVALHLGRDVGTRREVLRAAGVLVVTGGLMLIHPTYAPSAANRGTPAVVPAAHFASGLTPIGPIATVLAVVATIGIVAGVVRFARGERRTGAGPWLVVTGLAIIAVGVAAFALKWPTGVRGQADRNYVVSSIGAAMAWVGIAQVLLGRWRVALAVAALAFVGVLALADVRYQRDWAESAQGTRRMLEGVDCRYPGELPEGLAVGPAVPVPGAVRALHPFFLADASLVTVGRPLDLELSEDDAAWRSHPSSARLTWTELEGERCDR